MKKSLFIVSCIFAAIILSGCKSTEAENQSTTAAQQAASASSVIGADGVARPDWVLTGKEDDTGIYAVGSGKLSNDQNSLKLARSNARTELSRTVAASTQSVLRTYTQDTGNSKDVLNYLEEATQIKTANILQGSKQVDMWKAADGTYYVLMYVPYKAILPEVTTEVSNFVQDTKTVLTEAKALEAFKKYFDEQ